MRRCHGLVDASDAPRVRRVLSPVAAALLLAESVGGMFDAIHESRTETRDKIEYHVYARSSLPLPVLCPEILQAMIPYARLSTALLLASTAFAQTIVVPSAAATTKPVPLAYNTNIF